MTGWLALALAILIAGILTIRRMERRRPYEPSAERRRNITSRPHDPEAERWANLAELHPFHATRVTEGVQQDHGAR